jgi:hypothetical protein
MSSTPRLSERSDIVIDFSRYPLGERMGSPQLFS